MKRFIVLLALAALLTSCSRESGYSDDVPCSEVCDKIEKQLIVDFGYDSYGEEHLRYYFDDTEEYDDFAVRYSVLSEDINEFGVFHVRDKESRDEVYEMCEEYIEELREDERAFIESYAPKELEKLDGAEVKFFGNYVVYAILDSDGREKLFDTAKKVLSEKDA